MTKKSSKELPCGRPVPVKPKSAANTSELLKVMTQRLEDYVASEKLNRSEAREKILATIVSEARHFRAQDLLDRLKQRYPEVGKATVYRNLPVLVSSGVLQEGPMDKDGQAFYELSDDEHHDHIVCMNCHQIFEFHDEAIEKRQETISAKLGFKPRAHKHVVYAECTYLHAGKR